MSLAFFPNVGFLPVYWPYVLLLGLFVYRLITRRIVKPRHKRKIASSRKALDTLNEITSPAVKFSYLRKVDPFVFEEMILTSLNIQGYKIVRNKSYTGDGGIDGQVYIGNELVLIQAKRYSRYISATDISDFSLLCERLKCKGLFVHTGKTGSLAWHNQDSSVIDIVSGNRMLSLLTSKRFIPCWLY